MRFFSWKSVAVLFLLCPAAVPQTPAALSLRQITARAGYIFAGTVTAVERIAARQPGEVETIRITFRIDQGVRGVRTRQSLVIREWAGLWTTGERYRLGERVVLMLYPPSKLGLTSPVGGALGRFALDGKGELVLPPPQTQFLAADPAAGPWLKRKGGVSGRDFARILGRAAKE
jgi:hypothetical protein